MPLRIVITGAPASGKSEFIERLKNEPQFKEFVFLDEVARRLLEQDPTYRERWAEFHHEVYRKQLEQEKSLEGRSFITDRGTADAFAFHPETAAHCGTTIENEYRRYDEVILLESTARLGEPCYIQDDIRTESTEEALALEEATINVWKDHPNFHIVKAEADPEAKYENFLQTLLRFLRE
jgi:predicted ATPase